ncbi:MAG: hypothetical protein Q4F69_10990, partial [Bacteroidia bacterium]|nr:hypothetical protein [Bacteroidia bacterium]
EISPCFFALKKFYRTPIIIIKTEVARWDITWRKLKCQQKEEALTYLTEKTTMKMLRITSIVQCIAITRIAIVFTSMVLGEAIVGELTFMTAAPIQLKLQASSENMVANTMICKKSYYYDLL